MISFSVRTAVKGTGRAVSLGRLAQRQGKALPLAVRSWLGALPPGRIFSRTIPLDVLQHKFDAFVNDRQKPLVKLRLHGDRWGEGTYTISLWRDDPAKEWDVIEDGFLHEPATPTEPGKPLELGMGPLPSTLYRFNDVNTDRVTLNIVNTQPVGIEVRVFFDTKGKDELRLKDYPNVDFDGLNIKLKFEFSSNNGAVDLVGWLDELNSAVENAQYLPAGPGLPKYQAKFRNETFIGTKKELESLLVKKFIVTDASVNVADPVPDGLVASAIESIVNRKIFEALNGDPTDPPEKRPREILRRAATNWLAGGPFHVFRTTAGSQALTIDSVVPFGHPEPFPENPQQPLDPGLLRNIDHIVVLMMENRSYDHMLGYLHAERPEIDGLRGGEKNPYEGRDYLSHLLSHTVFDPGPCHDHECVVHQMNGVAMDGFVRDYARRAEAGGVDPGQVMGYHNAAQVPVYDALAREFLICKRWFAAHPGPTFPNRFYTLTGRLNRDGNGQWQFDNPGGDMMPVFTRTIFDHLTERGISWRFYEHDGYCFLRLFEGYTFDTTHILDAGRDADNFVAAARAGALPSVTFIDPDYINVGTGNDDQPPVDIANGQHMIGKIVNALINSPLWSKTLLIITYDEHGGFFDHVPPPAAPVVSAIDRYGVRVPAFVVSPWVDPGRVTDIVFDHTSIAKTIARRFMSSMPPDMGQRMAAAGDLSAVLRSTVRQDRPTVPIPPKPARVMAAERTAAATASDQDDLRGIMKSLKLRRNVRKIANAAVAV